MRVGTVEGKDSELILVAGKIAAHKNADHVTDAGRTGAGGKTFRAVLP